MSLSFSEDIRSITDLKRKTREILDQIHRTGRPVVLTVNGRADAVLMDAKTYEKHLKAANLSRLLIRAEEDIATKRTRPMRSFLKEFKKTLKTSGILLHKMIQSSQRNSFSSWKIRLKHWNIFPKDVRSFLKMKYCGHDTAIFCMGTIGLSFAYQVKQFMF